MKQRLEYLDTAKGILILLVLIGHIWDDGPVHLFIYSFHMPAFFLISGILFHHTSALQQPLWKSILRRAKALLIPFVWFEVYGIVLQVITEGAYLNFLGYVFQVLTLRLINGPLWFLVVLFCGEMLFLCLHWLLGQMGLRILTPVLLVICLFMPRFADYINPTAILFCFLFLCVGYLLSTWLTKYNICATTISLALVLVLSQCNRVDISNYQEGIPGVFFLTALAGCYAVLSFSRLLHEKLLRHYGKNTLIVLGTHYPINRAVKRLLHAEHFSTICGLIYFLIQLVYELLFIYVINRWLPFVLGRGYPKGGRKTARSEAAFPETEEATEQDEAQT